MNLPTPPENPDAIWPPFELQGRPRIVFGPGALARLGPLAAAIAGPRVFLVSDPGLAAPGHTRRATAALTTAGLEVTPFDAVVENPTAADVAACAAALTAASPDLIVALGGGSAIDTAKAAALTTATGRPLATHAGHHTTAARVLPLLVVPTTAGTGSECQSSALIGDATTHRKLACLDPQLLPRLTLLDPELTLTLPARVTAASGLDTLTHAIEAAVTTARTAASSLYAREAFRLAITALTAALARPADLAPRCAMLWASALAGMAIEASMLGAAHASGNPLTRTLDLTHGFAVSVMLPAVVRFNALDPAAAATYAALARVAGLADPTPAALADHLDALVAHAGAASALTAAAPKSAAISSLADEAATQWTGTFNPRPVAAAAFAALYAATFARHAPAAAS
ncbi:MAG: iron-containing alcohol dehydrogenase [Myxococcota bacterium]